MTAVLRLRHEEPVRLDRAQIEVLIVQLGPARAGELVAQAMEDLAVGLSRVRRTRDEGRFEETREAARGIVVIARQMGMTALARVARDVADLAETFDSAACAACVARLVRLGEASLVAVWDLQDASG